MNAEAIVNDYNLIIGLLIALLLAVGWVVFFVGRVVICIIRDARAARRPPRQFQHPEFGTLAYDSSLWSGQIHRGGRNIRFTVAGTEAEPDSILMERLRASISHLPELEKTALEFVRNQQPEVRQGEFSFESLDFLWDQKPDAFAMEFALTGDDDGIWRVEFEGGVPRFVGRDD